MLLAHLLFLCFHTSCFNLSCFQVGNSFLPFYFDNLGVSSIGFVPFFTQKRKIGVGFPKKMAWSLDKCDVDVDNKLGVVRPATELYSKEAVEALKAGKVIAVPTDTLYGFACDAWYAISTQCFLFTGFHFFNLCSPP